MFLKNKFAIFLIASILYFPIQIKLCVISFNLGNMYNKLEVDKCKFNSASISLAPFRCSSSKQQFLS